MLSEALTTQVTDILKLGLAVFVVISGLKNIPVISGLFDKWPQLAIIVNALASLFAAWLVCLTAGGFEFLHCTLTALGVFLAAAGIHLVKKSLETKPALR